MRFHSLDYAILTVVHHNFNYNISGLVLIYMNALIHLTLTSLVMGDMIYYYIDIFIQSSNLSFDFDYCISLLIYTHSATHDF